MISNLAIDTGDERNVTGHLISGAIFFGVLSGGVNYTKYKKDEISKQECVNDTVKMTVQGAIATASAIATANYVGKGNILGVLGATAVGVMGVYATQKVYDKLEIESKKQKELEDAK